jgi:hypothetical protein
MFYQKAIVMKNVVLILTLILGVSAVNTLLATDSSFPDVKMKGIPAERKVSLVLEGLKENHTIMLQDANAVVLMKASTGEHRTYAKVLNLKNLPNGTYYVVIDSELKKMVQPISLQDNGVQVYENRSRTYYKPFIKVHEGYIDLSLFNGRLADVAVTIYNNKGREVFTETFENILTVERRYQMKKFANGKYTMKVKTPQDTYFKQFVIRQ